MTLTRRSLLLISTGSAAMAATGAWAQTPAIQNFGIGDPAAKVKMVEYLSFTCPHCQRFHTEIYPRLKADYIDTGKLRLDLHEVYFDQYGLLGAMVARCGGELRYMGITDMLFDKQREWAGSDDINVAAAELKKIGRTAGMNDEQLDACLRDQTMAEALVAHYQENIATDFPGDSFEGTPSFIINGSHYGNMSYEELQKILDAELAK
jgi:protein-disulfide isomerase